MATGSVAPDHGAAPEGSAVGGTVRVWDPLVRLFHWSLAGSVALAWLTAEEILSLHEVAGYAILGLLLVRSVWGLAGPPHARFSAFVTGPAAVARYLRDLARGRPARHLGHNPAGAAMIVALLSTLAGTVLTGVLMARGAGEALEELHEGLATAVLVLVGLHVAGVLASSLLHGENLVAAMVTGRKRAGR